MKKTIVTNHAFATVAANAPSLVCGQTVFCPLAKRKDKHSKQLARGTNTMKVNQWTLGLAAAGVISFGAVAQAEEKPSSQVLTAVSSTTLSGYVSTSAHWNPGKSRGEAAAAAGAGYAYGGGKGDGFNLNVVDITISKPLDEGEWATGYTAELWLGPDAAGIGNGIGAAAPAAGIAIKQAYVALNAPVGNGLTFKMGVFDTIVGYEAANAGDNPNYTRSYGYTIEPTQHTGLLASYKVCDGFSVTTGVANTYNAALNARAGGVAAGQVNDSQKTYMAGISLTAPDSWGFIKGAVLNAGVVNGDTSATAAVKTDTTLIYVGATIPTPWETIKTGVSWDHLQFARTTGIATPDADAFALYASFSGIEKLKINTRLEYFDNGGGVVALGGPAGTGGSNIGVAGTAEILAATVTLDYALWANVISRLEYRLDHDLSGNRNFARSSAGTPGAGGENNSHLLALNIIYKF